jgi:hypothetical protein
MVYNYLVKQGRTLSLLIFVFFLFPVFAGAQQDNKRENFFIAPLGEFSGYGNESISAGGGLAVGGGDGVSIGLRLLYSAAFDERAVSIMETTVFIRAYFFGRYAYTGPFVQLNSGVVVVTNQNDFFVPTSSAAFSAGLGAGWRFQIGKRLFLEPMLRGGYPYLFGAGVSLGIGF